jgi:tetratricopeptide (TPR) repeat protein
MQADFFILQVCEFLDNGDGMYRFHEPSRLLSQYPGVVVVDCDLNHRFLPPLLEAADVLILQGFDWDLFPLIGQRRAADRATVLEANDYYYDVQTWNPRAPMWLDRSVQEEFRQCMAEVDAVQTSSPELARHWQPRSRRVVVFPNQLTDIPPLPPIPERPLTIGWGGSTGHQADWYHLVPVLEKWLAANPHVQISVMADEMAQSFLHLPPDRYRRVPVGSLAAYCQFVRSLDIGLAPLLPTDFNRCRSDVKFLEYAVHGAAGIYADLEPYRACVVHEQTGMIYRTEGELCQHLDRLTADAELRRRIREQAYQFASTHRRLADHVGERYDFYRGLLAQAPRGATLPAEAVAAAVRNDRYLQLRPQQPEQALQAAMQGPTNRDKCQTLMRLVEQSPNYLAALQQLGKQLNDLRDQRSALVWLERALALNPHSARTLCEIGRAYFVLGDSARGRQFLEKALAINPYYQLGWQYLLRLLSLGRSPDGPRVADRARELHPGNFLLALTGVPAYPPAAGVAVLHRLLDSYAPTFSPEEMPGAAVVFGQAIQDVAGPLLPGEAALALVRRACEIFPDSARLANLLGRGLHLAGKHAESNEHFARALDIRRMATGYAAEFPKESAMLPFWQFAEGIRKAEAGQPPGQPA